MLTIALSVLLQAAPAPAKPVAKETTKPTILWASADGYRSCIAASQATVAAMTAQLDAHTKKGGSKARADVAVTDAQRDEDSACKPVTVLEITAGTALELSTNPGPCAIPDADKVTKRLARARISAGPNKDTIGCVLVEVLRDPAAF